MSTIAMPNGERYRISSVRRYIVVSWNGHAWEAWYRTEDESRALAKWRDFGRHDHVVNVIDSAAVGGPAVIR